MKLEPRAINYLGGHATPEIHLIPPLTHTAQQARHPVPLPRCYNPRPRPSAPHTSSAFFLQDQSALEKEGKVIRGKEMDKKKKMKF